MSLKWLPKTLFLLFVLSASSWGADDPAADRVVKFLKENIAGKAFTLNVDGKLQDNSERVMFKRVLTFDNVALTPNGLGLTFEESADVEDTRIVLGADGKETDQKRTYNRKVKREFQVSQKNNGQWIGYARATFYEQTPKPAAGEPSHDITGKAYAVILSLDNEGKVLKLHDTLILYDDAFINGKITPASSTELSTYTKNDGGVELSQTLKVYEVDPVSFRKTRLVFEQDQVHAAR